MRLVSVGSLAALAIALVAGSSPVAAQQPATTAAPTKVGFVNMRAILAATPGFAKAESTFAQEMAGYRSEFQKLQVSLDSAASDFEQQATLLSASARTAKRTELQTRQQQLEERGQELQQRMVTRERELLDPIQTRVVGIIEQVRAAEGFAMIFDVSAQTNAVVTADKSLDLSERVIARLRTTP